MYAVRARTIWLAMLTLVAAAGLPPAAHADLFVSAFFGSSVQRYDEDTGALTPNGQVASGSGGLTYAAGVAVGPDGNLYVSSRGTGQVLKYDGTSGAFLGVFATLGGGAAPSALQFGPDANLYVSDSGGSNVLRFNGVTGAFLDNAATGLASPAGFAFHGPTRDLYVSEFGGADIVRVHAGVQTPFVAYATSPLYTPDGLLFTPSGELLVADLYGNQIVHYDGGGNFLGIFATLQPTYPPDENDGLIPSNAPAELAYDRHGNVLVAVLGHDYNYSGTVLKYDSNGTLLSTFASGINAASSLALTPSGGGYQWNADQSGNWSDPANWKGAVPNAAGATANFLGAITSDRVIILDADQTVGTLNFNNSHSYYLAARTLTLDGGGNAFIDVTEGSHYIYSTLAIADNNAVTYNGPGTLTIAGTQSHGVNTSLTVNSGVLNMTTDAGAVGVERLTVNANAAVNFTGTEHLAALNIGPNTLVTLSRPRILAARPQSVIDVNSQVVLVTGSLSMAATADLDLKDNSMVVHGGEDPTGTFLAVEASIANAFNHFGLDGHGIRSSAIQDASATGLGSALNSLLAATFAPLGSMNGEPLTLSDTIVKYTYMGDATLDGVVNDDDVSIIGGLYDNGTSSGRHWFEGDFTHDGLINDDDVSIISGNYNPSAPPLSARMLQARFGAQFASAFERGLAAQAVPEPGSLMLGLCGAALLPLFWWRSAALKTRRRKAPRS